MKPTKMVSYCEHVKVMVVPSIADLEDENLLETLWYTRREYQQMKVQYTADLRTTNTTRINGQSSARATTSERGTRRATTSTAVFGRFFLLVLLVYSGSCIAVMEGVGAFSLPPVVGTNYRHNRRSRSMFPAAVVSTTAMSSTTTTTLLLEPYLLVGIFGRLADKLYVVATTEEEEGGTSGMTGTAASGYEFGVLEAGRPKWLCTYPSRHGQSQGGGATVTHVPHWCSRLFAASTMDENDENKENDETNLLTKEKLVIILQELTFEMPLGAAPGLKQKAALPLQLSLSSSKTNDNDEEDGVEDSTNNGMIVDCLWTLFAGGNTTTTDTNTEGGRTDGVTQDAVARHLKRMATNYGSNPDSMTYATFERAMQAQAQQQQQQQ